MSSSSQPFSITVATLDNTQQIIEIGDNTARIDSKLDQIKKAFNNNDEVNLIYAGRILDVTKTFADYGIAPTNRIIMVKRAKKNNAPTQQPAQQPVQQSAQQPVQQSAQQPVQQPAQQPGQQPAQQPTQQPVQQPTQQSAQQLAYQQLMQMMLRALQPTSEQNQPVETQAETQADTQGEMQGHSLQEIEEFWRTTPPNDNIPMYSMNQIHGAMPFFFEWILYRPNMMESLLMDPSNITNMLLGSQSRELMRDFLSQADSAVNSLRTGTNIVMNISNRPVCSQNNSQNQPKEQSNEYSEIKELMAMSGMSEAEVRSVYYECAKNITMAAEILLAKLGA